MGVIELAMFVKVISATTRGATSTLDRLAYVITTGVSTRMTTSFRMKGENSAVTTTTAGVAVVSA